MNLEELDLAIYQLSEWRLKGTYVVDFEEKLKLVLDAAWRYLEVAE